MTTPAAAARTSEPPQPQGDGSNIPPPPPPPPPDGPEPLQGQGQGPGPAPGPGPPDHQASSVSRAANKVFKSGPLFLSSKGIGWTSWKKRWFILTGTSLVFFRSDPSAAPQKGGEVNLTLGGIDLNNSGSVVVKADKKLLTVSFADGRDGRAFTLKAETLEDLYEWKTALENALAQAPSATLAMGQNGILKNDQAAAVDDSTEQSDVISEYITKEHLLNPSVDLLKMTDKQQPGKAMVIGRPILLALEEVDGTPSFLEKALRFIEEHGIKVEGILRQAADVDDVMHRIREYEQGKTDFSPDEDAHVIGDCIKYILREMPSSPVPASCCNALLEACRVERDRRVNAMRTAILETFPEPNRCLLQRILIMMQTVASHKLENRMSISAVAACMAPLLLRPLLAGDCELENDFDVGGDGSMQLLQAAAAANHAQAIVVTLLEEYESIFGEGPVSAEMYSETEESGSDSEEVTEDDESYEDDEAEDDEADDDGSQYSVYTEDETENLSSRSNSRSYDDEEESSGRSYDDEGSTHTGKTDGDGSSPGSHHSSEAVDHFNENDLLPMRHQTSSPVQSDKAPRNESLAIHRGSKSLKEHNNSISIEALREIPEKSQVEYSTVHSTMSKSTTIASGCRRPAVWGRAPAKKNLSMESIDISFDDELEIQKLENTKDDLKSRISEEVQNEAFSLKAKENTVLRANLEDQKKALHERRQVLEQEVAKLKEQLQKEKDIRRALEAGLKDPRGPIASNIDEKTKADLEDLAKSATDIDNLKQKIDDLGVQLGKQREENHASGRDSGSQPQQGDDDRLKVKSKKYDDKAAKAPCATDRSNSSKSMNSEGTQNERRKRLESKSSKKRHHSTHHHHQLDSVGSGKSHHNEQSANSALSSQKSVARAEGNNSPASALSKLTKRLNFLKEKRTQIANELKSMDKRRSLEKARASEIATASGSINRKETEDTAFTTDKSNNPETKEDLNKPRSADNNVEPSASSRMDSRS